ncbi:MAG: hypothetical protein ABR956_13145 [Terracidiphilus sp.]|jgi:hypothetical protein
MARARIVAIAFAFVAATLAAQQAQGVHLTIRVTDPWGAIVPGASIQAGALLCGTNTGISAITGETREAAIDLSTENHLITLTAKGFPPLFKMIDIRGGSEQTVVAVLTSVATTFVDGICLHFPPNEILLVHPPVTAEIPLIPLQEFTAPAKPLRHRWRWL